MARKHGPDHFARRLERLRRRRTRFLRSLIWAPGAAAGVAVARALFPTSAVTYHWDASLFKALFGSVLLLFFHHGCSVCPRCTDFFYARWQWYVLSKRCLHCGLELFPPADPRGRLGRP